MKNSEEIRMRCTREQYDEIKTAADHLGLSVSAYVRMVALRWAPQRNSHVQRADRKVNGR